MSYPTAAPAIEVVVRRCETPLDQSGEGGLKRAADSPNHMDISALGLRQECTIEPSANQKLYALALEKLQSLRAR